jgi:catecholate siderophore receptor
LLDSQVRRRARRNARKARKKAKATRRFRARYWVAIGTLAAYSAAGSGKPALAQETKDRTVQIAQLSDPAMSLTVRRFNIQSGPLGAVIDVFEQSTGVRVRMSEAAIRNVSSPGAIGLYTVEQALQCLLARTGIDYAFIDSRTVALQLHGSATSVDVTASTAQVTSAKYTQPLLRTPQSVDVVQQQVLKDQGVTTLRDALRNFAGISLAAGEGGSQGDNLTIRGFTARNDLFIDGMRDFGSYYRDPFDLQEVEVLQGPSSVTFGRGSTGGVVNQAAKTPGLDHFASGALEFGTNETKRVTADVNTPVPAFGPGAAFRLNVMGNIGNVAGRDVAENRRFGVAPALVFGLGTPTRLTLSYFHQTEDDNPDYGIPWLFNGPAPVRHENYYGFEDGNYLRTYADIGTLRLEHDFNSAFTVRNQVRYANYDRDVLITEPQIIGVAPAAPLSAINVNRHQIGVKSAETVLDEQLDTTSVFKTGPITHTFVSGIEAARETSDPTRPAYSGVPATNLLEPNPRQELAGSVSIASRVHTAAVSVGAYALDTMKLAQKWELTAGIRFDRFDTSYTQSISPTSAFSRIDNLPTWRTALVYAPKPNGSVYFSAGDSFNPSAESLSLSAGNVNLPPEKNMSYEAGTKWDLASGRLSVRSAVFLTEKTNAREPDPNDPLRNVLAGKQRVDGVEAGVSGHITRHWQVLTGYAMLASKVVSSKAYPDAVGAQLANVPRNTATVWTSYDTPWHHLEIGGGGQFVDSRTASSTKPLDPTTRLVRQVPSYWVFNAMARYPLGEHVNLQANVQNLTNRYYYDELHPSHIVLGEGRVALIGINFKF